MADGRGSGLINYLDLGYAHLIESDVMLRNINSYEYLYLIYKNIDKTDSPTLLNGLKKLKDHFKDNSEYNSEFKYGNFYTEILKDIEIEIIGIFNLIDKFNNFLPKASQEDKARYTNQLEEIKSRLTNNTNAINAIYINPNFVLQRTMAMIEPVTDIYHRSNAENTQSIITKMMGEPKNRPSNEASSVYEGSVRGRMGAFTQSKLGSYNPQMGTNVPSLRKYRYNVGEEHPIELRCGTQGQYAARVPRVNPLFHAWLYTRANSLLNHFHVYINNLRLHRKNTLTETFTDMEIPLSEELQKLESMYPNIAVVTLPADSGFMHKEMYMNHEKKYAYNDVFNIMHDIAVGRSNNKQTDFYISDKIKKRIYGVVIENEIEIYNKETESKMIAGLLENSFFKLGFTADSILSDAQLQAVYFHFIKYEVTNFILIMLHPDTFNISCKDGIDRGGVSSLYYNLIKSTELKLRNFNENSEPEAPFSKEEFFYGLYSAPALVKARALNDHILRLWNVIDAYIDANNDYCKSKMPWLIEWRDNNCPEYSRKHLINQLNQYIDEKKKEPRAWLFSNKDTKLEAAIAVQCLLNGEKIKVFTEDQWNLVHKDRLGDIINSMTTHGLIDLDPYMPPSLNKPISPDIPHI